MAVFRDAFLALSTNRAAHKAVIGFPPSRKMTRRFVAGETLEEAIAAIRALNEKGMRGVFDYLGEAVTNTEEAEHARNEYLRILDAIETHALSAYASLKPTQMGLAISHATCFDNISMIARRARQVGTMVRVEMEDSSFTQATLDLFRELHAEYANVGTVIQSCLYRSEEDMRELLALGANVRLVKGAYKEPPSVAFPKKKDVDANYLKLMELYLGASGEEADATGAFLALATHDAKIIEHAKQFVRERNVAHSRFEFQMLYGIRSELQHKLHAEGYPMRVYVPYGSMWYPYFMRRLAERPANVFFLLSNLFK
jgi:proline dehydrogenase